METLEKVGEITTRVIGVALLIFLEGGLVYMLYFMYTLSTIMGVVYTLPAIGVLCTLGLLVREFIRQIKLVARGEEVPKNPSMLQPPAFL
ncbi:MAG: hypothetical protein WC750_05630 [Patescibacteria group bacterium]|jgi:hypothetical protein